jgi:flagellar hook assembly protein FlgD
MLRSLLASPNDSVKRGRGEHSAAIAILGRIELIGRGHIQATDELRTGTITNVEEMRTLPSKEVNAGAEIHDKTNCSVFLETSSVGKGNSRGFWSHRDT